MKAQGVPGMIGEEVRTLRRRIGMSQAEFAEAIGISRETVGRLERGGEEIDRRTELAIRFVVEKGPEGEKSLRGIHENVTNILDEAAVRGRVSAKSRRSLKRAGTEWAEQGGSKVCLDLIRRAQATVGWLDAMGNDDPSRAGTFAELRRLKLAWQAVAEDI